MPTSISFSPDDTIITYLLTPDHTFSRKEKLLISRLANKNCLLVAWVVGRLDESNISSEKKLRRKRLRECGLGVTWYELVKTSTKNKEIVLPLLAGVCSIIS